MKLRSNGVFIYAIRIWCGWQYTKRFDSLLDLFILNQRTVIMYHMYLLFVWCFIFKTKSSKLKLYHLISDKSRPIPLSDTAILAHRPMSTSQLSLLRDTLVCWLKQHKADYSRGKRHSSNGLGFNWQSLCSAVCQEYNYLTIQHTAYYQLARFCTLFVQ